MILWAPKGSVSPALSACLLGSGHSTPQFLSLAVVPWYWHLQNAKSLLSLGCKFTSSFSWALVLDCSPAPRCQTSAAFYDPFMPSKSAPCRSSAQGTICHFWNTASVCRLWGNTSQKPPLQWCWSLFITADSPQSLHTNGPVEPLLPSEISQVRPSSFALFPTSLSSKLPQKSPTELTQCLYSSKFKWNHNPPKNTQSVLSQQ